MSASNKTQAASLERILPEFQVPPTLTVPIPKLEDIDPPKRPGKIPTDVVLLTVNEEEFLASYAYMKNVTKWYFGNLSWVYFGEIGDNNEKNVQISLVKCSQGSESPGAAATTAQNAIRILGPKGVVCFGYCGALNLEKVRLGDVVLSTKLATYSNTKVTSGRDEVRPTISCVSSRMRNLIMCAAHGWKAPFEDNNETQSRKVKLHCPAEIVSGPQLVVSTERREELLGLFPGAIAIEMEGEGVYSACHDLGVEWAVIKGVSDYADDTKYQTASWKLFASAMAASVVNHMFRDPEVLDTLPHYSETVNYPKQVSRPFMERNISELNRAARRMICKKLDIKMDDVDNDFTQLAAHFEMPLGDLRLADQASNPTDCVLRWAARKSENTIGKLYEILKEINRDDCTDILDEYAKEVTASDHENTDEMQTETREVKWNQVSKTHRPKLDDLTEILKSNPSNSSRIGKYRVCLEKAFCVGEGSDKTRVYVGLSDDGREVAVKRLSLDLYNEIGENEVKILMERNIAKEQHVLTLLHCDVVDGYGYLILDLCDQTLKEYVASHKKEELEKEGPRIIRQILLGLKSLHCGVKQTILHRDLKPSNILVDADDDFFLSDFGISRIIGETQETLRAGPMGTHGWMATESISVDADAVCQSDNQLDVRYKAESDIQVAGMLFFYILTGGMHPYGPTWVDQCYNIKKGIPIDLDKHPVNLIAKDLIKWMLEQDPKNRPTVEDCLKHPFLRSRDERFNLITRVGKQVEIKTKDATSPIVQQLNCDPLVPLLWLPQPNWKSVIDPIVLNYISGKRKYSTDVADLLRFIRNTEEHWGDHTPPPIVLAKVGKPTDYFSKIFPALPVHLHRIIRNNDPTWKKRDQLEIFF